MSRGNGEGSVSQRADGRWEARWYESVGAGKRRRRSTYRASEAAAKRALKEALRRVDDGLSGMDSRTSLKVYAERWMVTTLAVDAVKDSTRRLYRDTLRLWVLPYLGHRRLSDLRPGDVEEMQTTLIGGGLSPSSAQGAHKVLRRVLSTAVRDGLISRNPVLAVRGPSVPRSTKKVPDRADVRRILDSAEGRMRPLVALLAFTGMRVGEALALRWSDIDLTRGTVQINGTLARDRDLRMLVRTPPKTERSRRTLPLPAPLITELQTWRRVQSAERLAAPVWATEEDWVVTTTGPSPREVDTRI
jgi:integrase